MKSQVIWITGLSGAGKTTLACEVYNHLKAQSNSVIMLDGDQLREVFSAGDVEKSHDRQSRLVLAMQYAHLCKVIAEQGITVVIATISLFREVHQWNREHLPNYFEVFLKVPLEELRRRDPKNIYQDFDSGKLSYVAGLDIEVDEALDAHWVIEYQKDQDVSQLATELIVMLEE